MPASKAIPSLTSLVDPNGVAAKARAEADAADATRAECLDRAKNRDLLHAGIRHLQCGAYQEEIAAVEAQVDAEQRANDLANGDRELAACIEKRIDPRTKDQRFEECEPFEAEVAHALAKAAEMDRMTLTQWFNAGNDVSRAEKDREWRDTAKDKREAAVRLAEEKKQLDAILGTETATENQTAAAPAAEEEKPAIDEANKTAAIEADPKPAEQQPVKIKPKKLDL